MTNYYKVYITNLNNGKSTKIQVKNADEVKSIIFSLKDCKYQVIKRIKGGTDVPVASGTVYNGERRILHNGLDIDYRIVDGKVVDYKKYQEDEGR